MRRTVLLLSLVGLLAVLAAAPLSAQDVTYTMRYGDVLDLIAASFDVSVDCIVEASDIANPNRLRPGDVLVIRSDCPRYDGQAFVPNPRTGDADEPGQGGGGAPATARANARGDAYVVQVADVLDLIAASFDVSVSCIAEANELPDPNRIRPGDSLTIPADCPRYDGAAFVPNPREVDDEPGQGGGGGGNVYVVRPGDVLDVIAARYDIDVACLAEASGIANVHRIMPGDEITLDLSCPRYSGDNFVTNPREG